MRKYIRVGGFCLLFCMSWALFSQPVAKVLVVSGSAQISRSGQTVSIGRGSNLFVGDVISTKGSASVRLRYLNGTLVTLSRGAHYEIQKYSPQQDVEIEASLTTGQAQIVTEGDASKKEILNTKVVAMAIIGTDVIAYVADGSRLEINLIDGLVNIDGIAIQPGVYNVSVDEDNNVTITTPDGREVSEPDTDDPNNAISVMDTEDLTSLISTNIAAEIVQVGPPDTAVTAIEIVCI